MNNTSGFKDVRSSILRSSAYRFMHERRHQCGTDFWQFLRTHDLIVLSLGTQKEIKGSCPGLNSLVEHWYSRRTGKKELHIERHRHHKSHGV